jgi:hypothetical protein
MEDMQKQNFDLITEMIQTARKEFNDSSSIYLLWGWVICIASLLEFILIQMHYDNISGIGWPILLPIAFVCQIVIMVRNKNKEKVKTHIDTIMGYLWSSFGISLGIVLFSYSRLQANTLPMVLMLYAIGTFVSGGAMQVRALIVGGIACWVIAIACFFVSAQDQILLLAIAVIVAYIIPGYILKIRHRKHV